MIINIPPGTASRREAVRTALLAKATWALNDTYGAASELVETVYRDKDLGNLALSLAKQQQAKHWWDHVPKRRVHFVSGGQCSPR